GAGRGEQEQGQGKDFYQAEAMQVQGRLPCCGINSRSALTFPWQSGPGWIARLAKIPPSKPKTGLPGTPAARIDDLVGSGSPGRTSPLRDNSSLYPATLPTVAEIDDHSQDQPNHQPQPGNTGQVVHPVDRKHYA